jgi:hypothetical protein
MNDKKFMELLNLYVDREVGAEDALRLEAEVATNPSRRRVYDQYCRIQKACSMLSEEQARGAADPGRGIASFPARSAWRPMPLMAALAAACVVAVLAIRERGSFGSSEAPTAAAGAAAPLAFASAPALQASPVAMEPVFVARLAPTGQAQAGAFPVIDASAQDTELSWIGGIHMTPVFPAANADFLLDPKSALKTPGFVEPQDGPDSQGPVEMTAFRFQR